MIHYLPKIGASLIILALVASIIATEFTGHNPFAGRKLLSAAIVISVLVAIAILAV